MKIETKFKKIKAMPDSNLKLLKVMILGTEIGMFDKQPMIDEMHRLMALGYKAM